MLRVYAFIDSLCYHIKHDDIYKVMGEGGNIDDFDTSGYPKNDPRKLYSAVNAKVVGKFKDECDGRAAYEFVGLRSKMYSLFINKEDKKPKMTAKGIKRSYVKHHVTHEMYLNTLCSKKLTNAEFSTFRSKLHRLQTIKLKKTCLSAFDDKRFVLGDGITTLAYGHCEIGVNCK